MIVELGRLGVEQGGHLLIKHALRELEPGATIEVRGQGPGLAVHLGAWCRAQGHGFELRDGSLLVRRGALAFGRARGAERAGGSDAQIEGAVAARAKASWGLAARGALVELGTPAIEFSLSEREQLWTDDAAQLYARAAASQWDPSTAIDWSARVELDDEIEDAVVQVMTYLIENETVALLVPARFLARVHPHFREIMQVLAIQAADEARHIEVFTRRATLRRHELGLSTAGGQASLATLLDEPDFALASFLLAVLGEGSFLALLRFIEVHAPDPITRAVARLAAQDEARHVAFGMSHLLRHAAHEPALLGRLALAIERRHDALAHTAGLNEEVFDALILLAAGSWTPGAIGLGFARVVELQQEMDRGRRLRLRQLGFSDDDAERLSSLHTRNFM